MSVLRNIVYFLFASVLAKPLGFVLSFVLARSLGPTDFGVWVTLSLVIAYSPIACLGAVETLLKKVPYYLGRKELDRLHETENAVMGSIVLSAIFVVVATAALPLVPEKWLAGLDRLQLGLIMLSCAVTYFSAFFYQRFAAYQNFRAAGNLDLLRSCVAVVLVGSGAYFGGLTGATFGYLAHECVVCLCSTYYSLKLNGPVGVSFHRKTLVQVIQIGFPITLLWWTATISTTVDRLVIGGMLGAEAVGHYALGLSLNTLLALLPVVVGRVLYPHVNRHVGQTASPAEMKRIVLGSTFTLATLLSNVQLVIFLGMPFLYTRLLPKYLPGLAAGEILVIGSFYISLVRNGANYLIAINQESVFLRYILFTLASNIGLDIAALRFGFGLSGVAVATSLSGVVCCTLVWRRVLLNLEYRSAEVWRTIGSLCLPNVLLSGLIALLVGGWRLDFSHLDFVTVSVAILLVGAFNGALSLHSHYRADFVQAWKTILQLKASRTQRAVVAELVATE